MNRDFKGIWIPREIWLAKELGIQEKALWAEIDSLYDEAYDGCWADNEYLMDFMQVKERRIQEMIANLKAHGYLEQVSFNGRTRVLKALMPTTCKSVRGRGAEKCTPEVQDSAPLPYYRDIRDRDNTPPIPPHAAPRTENEAKASEVRDYDFSQEVKEITQEAVKILKEAKPSYKQPRLLNHMQTSVDQMIRLDKRTGKLIITVFRWAVGDPFWCDKMFKPNPMKYLRDKFDQLEMKMNAKPETSNAPIDRRNPTLDDKPWIKDRF